MEQWVEEQGKDQWANTYGEDYVQIQWAIEAY